MELTEKTLESREIFRGRIVTLKVDKIELPDGHQSGREVVEHPGGVAVLPLDDQDMVTLVRQYRYPFGKVITELPAGKLEKGEDPLVCAQRELSEEVGAEADELIYLGKFFTSPGYSTEVLHMYLARGLRQGQVHPDEDEFLESERLPFLTLFQQVMSGEIEDGKTIAAVLKTKLLLGL